MFYYLYEIRNNLNGKIYVGVHKTKKIDDGYMGSGKVIKRAIEKYGIDNFTKVILETFENAEAMYAREKAVVTDEFLLREDVYNLRRGGSGGFDYINKENINIYGTNGQPGFGGENLRKGWDRIRTVEEFSKISKTLREGFASGRLESSFKNNNPMYDANLKERHRQALATINHQQGMHNSQYGSMWITDGIRSAKIKKTDRIPEGWQQGRKQK
jgi:hypothetical protein